MTPEQEENKKLKQDLKVSRDTILSLSRELEAALDYDDCDRCEKFRSELLNLKKKVKILNRVIEQTQQYFEELLRAFHL